MASIPGYSAAGRSRSFDGATAANSDENSTLQETVSSQIRSTEDMEDTETVFLNKGISTPSHGSEISSKLVDHSSKQSQASDDDEPRKCWICYTDETEDSPLNLEWRSPCPCALTAHEACLLDWLADMENPRSRRNNGGGATMVCPQCKTEIVVTRPRSFVVDGLRVIERAAGRLVLPGMMFTVAGTMWAGCLAHGIHSMDVVFGTEEATIILEELVDGPWTASVALGLPLIPLVLIFSRTRYGQGILPAVPVLFFISNKSSPEQIVWPPSPSVVFSTLPYIKYMYGAIYDRLFGRLEQKWIAEVQPRAAETLDDAQQQDQAEGLNRFNGDEDGNFLMEIDLQLQMGLGDGEEADLAFPIEQNDNANDGAPNGQAQDADRNNGLGLGWRQHEIINDTSNLAEVVLGALVFPAVSASMGGLLKLVLPKTWTTPPSSRLSSIFGGSPTGLLQTRWGRSVVGGCMFVVLKDALILYCRWKLAQSHRRRKVLNYNQSKKHHGRNRSTG
ncbi:Zinc fingerRING-CH-type [Penicillium sp. IBT 31633x]|nr:Zinc fingerRING-CH-type [Penicillium sp. IBT 31633x]